MEKYMERNGMEFGNELVPGIELDPAGLNWMAGPLFPSFTGSVPLTLDGMLPGIESDRANSQALSPWDGVEKCWKWSLLSTHSNGPSQLPGIEHGKMLEAVTSSNLFKWTWWPLFSTFTGSVPQDSAIQLVGCTHLLDALA